MQRSTVAGVLLLAIVVAAGHKELATPPLHTAHACLLAFLLLIAIALVTGPDEFFAKVLTPFVKLIAPFVPFGKKTDGAP